MKNNDRNQVNRKTVGAVERERERERERESSSLNTAKKNWSVILVVLAVTAVILMSSAIFGFARLKGVQSGEIAYNAEQLRMMSYDRIEEGEDYADEGNHVKFAPFFAEDYKGDEYSEKLLGTCNQIGKTDTMYIELSVQEKGKLVDGVITVNSKNFRYNMKTLKNTYLKNDCLGNIKRIELNDIEPGNTVLLMGDIFSSITSVNDYSRKNEITLTGKWVPDDGDEEEAEEINKTINVTVDWYGTAKSDIEAPYTRINLNDFRNSGSKTIEFDFTLEEVKKELLPKDNVIDVEIPKMFEQYPTDVVCKNTWVKQDYDEENHKLHIVRESNARDNTYTIELTYPDEVYDQLYNGYTMSVPVTGYYECYTNANEEFTEKLDENQVESESGIFKTKPVSATKGINFYTTVGVTADYMFSAQILDKTYVTLPTKTYAMSKDNILDAYDGDKGVDEVGYTVMWSVTKTTKETESALGIGMGEIKNTDGQNSYGDTWSGTRMSDCVKNAKIYFSNSGFINENGFVKVYDNDTGTLLKEFSYEEVRLTYTNASSAYEFDAPVSHIRIETNEVNPSANSCLRVYSVKKVDIDALKSKMTRDALAKIEAIKTDLTGTLSNGVSVTGADECELVVKKSYATISVQNKQLSATAVDPVEQEITVSVPHENVSCADWKNGEFLVGFESSESDESASPISYLELDSVTTVHGNVKISGYELVKKNGKYFIKIVTNNEEPVSSLTIKIKCKMLVNPMISSSTINVNLYSYNDNLNVYHFNTQDRYDVNDNGTTDENVGLSTDRISILSLNTFLTTETLSEYNEEKEVTIAPNIAEIEKKDSKSTMSDDGKATAKVNVSLINNYDKGNVNNVIIVGKIPFTGNTYADGKDSLGSKFTTTMMGKIELPSTMSGELKKSTKIYYSKNENPTKVTLENGKIKENVGGKDSSWIAEEKLEDFSGIKSYLIVIEDSKVLTRGTTYTFSYEISIPDDAKVNDASYSCHKVWYDYVSDGTKLPMESQPRKLGLRMVNYYDFDITKVKKGTTHPVKGAKFKLTEMNTEEPEDGEETKEISRIVTSDEQGKLSLTDLKVNQPYSFQEIQAPSAYELDGNIIRFKLSDDEKDVGTDGNTKVKFVYLNEDGTVDNDAESEVQHKFKEQVEIKTDTQGKPTLTAQIENTPKFALNITKTKKDKTEDDENEALPGVMFEISSGEGEEKETKTIITDSNGKAVFDNLKIGEKYTLRETYAKGYYLMKDVTFKLEENESGNGGYSVKCEDGTELNSEECQFENTEIQSSETSDLIQVNVNITNEKIPTYNLKIKKVEESNKIGPEEEEKVLPGATFFLERTDLQNSEFFTTGDDGIIKIEDMYAHVEDRDITGEYTLEETSAPSGYVNNREKIKFVVSKTEDENLDVKLYKGEDDSTAEGSGKDIKDFETIKDIVVEENTVTIIIQDKPVFKLKKVDEENQTPLANTEFIIYELGSDGSIAKDADGNRIFAKDANGNTVGTKKEDGTYVVTTDANGEITLPLGPGSYKAIEYVFPEGYEETPHSEVFTISGKKDDDESKIVVPDAPEEIPDMVIDIPEYDESKEKTIQIEKIEDLLDLAYTVNSGKSLENVKVELTTDLDFTSDSSYRNANSKYKPKDISSDLKEELTIEGVTSEDGGIDINGDNTVSAVKDELTEKTDADSNGKGFPSIGTITIKDTSSYDYKPFSGIFDGQGHTISNLYINDGDNGSYIGLFGYIENAVIKDLTVTGQITGKKYVGGICGAASGAVYLENLTNKCDITGTNVHLGGILGGAGNVSTTTSSDKKTIKVLNIKSCKNEGTINANKEGYSDDESSGGIVGEINNGYGADRTGKIVSIDECNNTGKIGTGISSRTSGICGYINNVEKVKIANTENEGEIKGSSCTGGLIGSCSADQIGVISCNNNGEVQCSSSSEIGGLIGYCTGGQIKVVSCYNNANISGLYEIGGLIGDWQGTQMEITKSYNKRNINGSGLVGGILGYAYQRTIIIYK